MFLQQLLFCSLTISGFVMMNDMWKVTTHYNTWKNNKAVHICCDYQIKRAVEGINVADI